MVILEGPDGAGKTTLAHAIQKKFGLIAGVRGTKDRDELYTVTRRDTYTALGAAVKGDEPVRVWDRLFYSELVYAPIVGRRCEFNDQEQMFIRRIIDALACPVIICMPPYHVVKTNEADAHQMGGVHDNIGKIYAHYKRLVQTEIFPPNHLLYDYTGVTGLVEESDVLSEVADYIDERKHRSW